MSLVSIIIPIYNVSAYLQDCLYSVLCQTYSNLDIIMINDGSTDGSEHIAQSFVDKDSRFRLITQSNGGLSSARNTGLSYAIGDYIFYLDADDFLAWNCIEKLVNFAQDNNLDVAQANFFYDYPSYLLFNASQKSSIISDSEKLMKELLRQQDIKNFAWGKLIRSEIAKEYTFPLNKYFEDSFWMYKIVHRTKRYGIWNEPLLYYLQRNSSISGGFSAKNKDLLEGDVERLMFVKKAYTSSIYSFGLKRLFRSILIHKGLVLVHLKGQEQSMYLNILAHYVDKFKLKKKYPLYNFMFTNEILYRLFQIINSIISRMSPSVKWKKQVK